MNPITRPFFETIATRNGEDIGVLSSINEKIQPEKFNTVYHCLQNRNLFSPFVSLHILYSENKFSKLNSLTISR